ncbi:MAG TPA: DNA polymerase I [Candidatus Saccharibacteria bacterium]|nr:DNA polymerase I [Candidatus Saccharibacteria bacterium]HRQ07021.1 DNA polymerase I [Candidatus Saccharibacteria bacterium]
MKSLAIIDGKSVFYRGYYAMPNLSLPDGTPTGGVFGFASLAIELIKKLEPDYVAVAWDKKGTNIRKRREIYPEYKAGRKKAPDDFYAQIPILYELLDAFGWPLYELDDYEADDIMGAFADEATKKGIETYLLTSDLDALQLVGPLTKVYALKNGLSNLEEFDVGYFEDKYGIKVEQFLDLKSLKGDSSDNLPGVPGIGEKTATQLLQDFGTLDGIYDNIDSIKPTVAKKLIAGKDKAYMSKEVGRIWIDAPVKLDWDVADVNDTNLAKVAEILKKLEFNSLIKRLPKHMQTVDTSGEFEQPGQTALPVIKKAKWPEVVSIDGPVVVHVEDDEIWLSVDRKTACSAKIADLDRSVWRVFEMATVISYDSKILYHQLASHGVFVKFDGVYDVHQAAFLINPLQRDRSLSALAGAALGDDPLTLIGAIWHIYDEQLESFKAEPKIEHIAKAFDFPLTYILFMMEHRGIKIDSAILKKMSQELGDEHAKLEKEMFDLVGYEFNIASPSQLSEVLFTKLQLSTTNIKKGKTGYSTGQKELDKLRGQHPIIELIEQTRELAKLKNTYVDTLPEMVDENGRLHTTFNQDVASTGRLSSTNPNLQNIPVRTELGRKIREAFIPDGDNVFVSADYSQFELRLVAVLAGDKKMINDFNGDVDIHIKTASDVYGIPMDDVTKAQRRAAKVINFGVLYGMSPHGLSAATGMTFAESKKFIDHYFELRAPVRAYINKTIEDAKNKGYVETYFGRRRPTPDVLSSNFMVRSGAERAAANMPIQGTEADLMKLAMIEVAKKIEGLGEQILQIHDSILVECPVENSDKISEILKTTMENIAPQLGIKLKVDVSVGKNWGEL